MDDSQAQSLDALSTVLGQLSESPLDIALHIKHIQLAQSIPGAETELRGAYETFADLLAAGEEVWLPLLEAKQSSADLDSASHVQELLALYERAENDYLSIPILQRHLQFLVEQHERHLGEGTRPAEFGELFTTEWTHTAIGSVVNKGIGHLTQSHLLWDFQRDWELEQLQRTPISEREELVERVQLLHLARLHQPHSSFDDTFQSYSSFTTNYKPASEYESLLVSASKRRAQAVKGFNRRESLENAVTQSGGSLEAYAQYITVERRAKNPDLFVLGTVFERAIAEAAKRRFRGEQGAEEVLRNFWVGYCDALRINNAEEAVEVAVLRRAVRSVPGSGEIWARYMRYLERMETAELPPQDLESIPDVFMKAINTQLVTKDVEQIVPVVLARAGYERRRVEAGKSDEDGLGNLIGVLESGLDFVRQASKTGDAKLRLEKYLADVYENLLSMPDSAVGVWQAAAKHSKSSYQIWLSLTDLLIKLGRYDEARAVFIDIHGKNIDWSEAIWEAWIAFEHAHGAVQDIDSCFDKVEKARVQVNMRRMKEAEKAMQAAYEQQATAVIEQAIQSAPQPTEPVAAVEEVPMVVDEAPTDRGTKRGAEEEPETDNSKRLRTEPKPLPLKRDRENTTVFVADLPPETSEEELHKLFRDCGQIREIKLTQLANMLVATVEFHDRDSVPAALTKDKKRIRGQEVAVHLAWKSTLYVTNFPESYDDEAVRALFTKYGTIFDIRWPSKKLKATRRFCYVQYTSPTSAEHALELHGIEMEAGHPLNVFISNPERKKERSDQDANDREIFVSQLSKTVTKEDLEKLFSTYGPVKDVRLGTDPQGKSKGFAFVEFESELAARTALSANNTELKKRRIAVTMTDSRVKTKNRHAAPETGLGRVAEIKNRSVRVRNLPPATQEGLLQQVFEKIMPVKRVEVFVDAREAVIELTAAADAGKLLLRTEPVVFQDCILELSEEGAPSRPAAPPPKTGGLFVPRAMASRPRAGLGHARKAVGATATASSSHVNADARVQAPQPTQSGKAKGQDDFRRMLGGS